MKFAEKSFEIRFCAALSAAIMPFNRNPQWFGMTQARERISGIDAMLKTRGRLLIFQFKAKHDEKFKLEKMQWRNLDRVGRRFPKSTFYVFPEAGDVAGAAAAACILKESWCCSASDLGSAFSGTAASSTLSLKPELSSLVKGRPYTRIPAQSVCQTLGCFCPPSWQSLSSLPDTDHRKYIHFSAGASREIGIDQPMPPFADKMVGIPIGDTERYLDDADPISSMLEFENLFGDGAKSNLAPGLWGLFLPQA